MPHVDTDEESQNEYVESWPKVCVCGCSITEEQWENLQYLGIQKVPRELGIPDLELRNCKRCMSTLAVVVPSDFT